MLINLNKTARKKTISLTPLIDVVFILLLFFMLTSSFLQLRQIDVSAVTPSKELDILEPPVIVTLKNNQGDFELEGRSYSISNAVETQGVIAKRPAAVYVVDTKDGVKTQSMIQLLDAFKQAGARSVSLVGVNE